MDTLNLLFLACKLAANLWVAGFWQRCKCRHLLKGHLSSLDFWPQGIKAGILWGLFFSLCEAAIVCKSSILCVWPHCAVAVLCPEGVAGRDAPLQQQRLQKQADDIIRWQNKTTLHTCPVVLAAVSERSCVRPTIPSAHSRYTTTTRWFDSQIALWCKFTVAPYRWF